MRVVFFLGHDGFIRNFEPVLHELAARGHQVHLALGTRRAVLMSEAASMDDLCARVTGLTWGGAPKGTDHRLSLVEDAIAASRDFLRFLGPEFHQADKLRARAADQAPAALVRIMGWRGLRSGHFRRALDALLRSVERRLPSSPAVRAFLDDHRPDVVLFSPFIQFRSRQVAALRTARRGGVPTAVLVHSWDNLTNKGLMHALPDRVLVWNEQQRDEAVRLHDVPREAVVITGAQSYDPWFDRQPSADREDLCHRLGLDPARALILYAGSSSFIAPEEPAFVLRWLAALRADPELAQAGVILRPHPQNREGWEVVARAPGRVAIWPPLGEEMAGESARADYFDCIHHAGAVVGINTSALIETTIQGRPVLTVRAPEFRSTQAGTLHFAHLVKGPGAEGVLTCADDLDEHVAQMREALNDPAAAQRRAQAFLKRFVRPHDLGEPATPRVVSAIEELAGTA